MYRKDLCAVCTLFDLKCCNKRMLSYCDETLKKKSMSQSVVQIMGYFVCPSRFARQRHPSMLAFTDLKQSP